MLSLKWALFLLLILLIPYNCESDSDSDSSDGDMTEDSTPKTPTAKEENQVNLKKVKIFDGNGQYFATYSLSDEITSETEIASLVETLNQPAKASLVASTDDPLQTSYANEDDPKYNPTAKYSDSVVTADFDPCGDWEDFADKFYIDNSLNYLNLLGHTEVRAMGESDLSRWAFGNDPNWTWDMLDKTTEEGNTASEKGNCHEMIFTDTNPSAKPAVKFPYKKIYEKDDGSSCIQGSSGCNEVKIVDSEALGSPYTRLANCLVDTLSPSAVNLTNKDKLYKTEIDEIAAGGKVTISPAQFDQYGNMLKPPQCVVGGIAAPWPSHDCVVFCEAFSSATKECYENPMMDGRRRFLSAPRDGTTNIKTPGLTYMSIKKSDDEIFTVRVMHNLHNTHINGDGVDGATEIINDDVTRRPMTFTFSVPFCPSFNTLYEYKVCNVPNDQHSNFTDCFADNAQFWIISDARVMEDKLNSPVDESCNYADGSQGICWKYAYQILDKTTFRIKNPGTEENLLSNNSSYKTLSVGSSAEDNLCKETVKGLFYINPALIEFFDHATEADGGGATSAPKNYITLYFDTNPEPEHWFHQGWRRWDPTTNSHSGNTFLNRAVAFSEGALVIPHSMRNPNFACYRQTGTMQPNPYGDGNYEKLKEHVIAINYSPLVLNVNHTVIEGSNAKPAKLVGLDANIKFIGRRFFHARNDRTKEYTETVSKSISSSVPMNVDVLTTAKVKTGWIDGSTGNALLVYDINGNGTIDSGMELFGESTVLEKDGYYGRFGKYKAGDFAENGFVALAQYDENSDGLIDSKDTIWSSLRLWLDGIDGTPDGITQETELKELSTYKIISIDIDKIISMKEVDDHGNETRLRAAYTYQNENNITKESVIFDVYFRYEPLPEANFVELDEEDQSEYDDMVKELEEYNTLMKELNTAKNDTWE